MSQEQFDFEVTREAYPVDEVTKGRIAAQKACDAAGEEWKAYAYEALIEYAKSHDVFMTEDVRQYARVKKGLPEHREERAWGGIVNKAVRLKLIKRVGFAPMKSKNCHGNPKSVWKWIGE